MAMSPVQAVPCQRHYPDIFPFPPTRPPSAVSRHPHLFTIVDRDLLPPQNNALSYVVSPSFLSLFSCLGHKFPLSSDFSHPFRCLDQSRLTRDGQTSPITSSNPISDFRSPPILPHGSSCLVLSPLVRLTHLTLTRPASPRFQPRPFRVRVPRTRAVRHVHHPHRHTHRHHSLLVTRFIRSTDTPDRLKPVPPDRSTC